MYTTTSLRRFRPAPVGTGNLRMFQAGLADGLADPSAPRLHVCTGFRCGCALGRGIARVRDLTLAA